MGLASIRPRALDWGGTWPDPIPLPMTRSRRPLAIAGLTSLFLAAGCSGGGGSSSSSNGGGGGDGGGSGGSLKVEFAGASQSVFEGDIRVTAKIVMNGTSQQDVFVSFLSTGDAQFLGDWEWVTPPPLKIPLLTSSADVVIDIRADDKGELDEILRLRITSAVNAGLGDQLQHLITILDEDATHFPEVEPNDAIADANAVGTIAKLARFDVTGEVQPGGLGDDFDVFELVSAEEHVVDLQVEGVDVLADLSLLVTDAANNPLYAVDDTGPGEDERGQYAASAGETFYVHVATVDAGTQYLFSATGLEFSALGSDGDGGPSAETMTATGFGQDRAGYMEWLRARRREDAR